MKGKGFLREQIRIEVVSADLPSTLNSISKSGTALYAVEPVDELKAVLYTDKSSLKFIREYADGHGAQITVLEEKGIALLLKRLLRRPLLMGGLLLLIAVSCVLPSRVFFIRVEGNERLPANLIVEKAGECGVSFGASRRAVRSEQVKNALLQKLSQLQWAGVNTKGCVATISVAERTQVQTESAAPVPCSIVAKCDGIVERCVVTRGNLQCKAGQAVKQGDVLVSAYTDCGLSITASAAEAEIYAKTRRTVSAVVPEIYDVPKRVQTETSRYALVIGKKRINFYNGSSILDASCVRIYDEKQWTLPGGLTLPVFLVKETWVYRDCSNASFSEEDAKQMLSSWAEDYVLSEMTAGSILARWETCRQETACYCFDGIFACSEMIGCKLNEEIFDYDDKDN